MVQHMLGGTAEQCPRQAMPGHGAKHCHHRLQLVGNLRDQRLGWPFANVQAMLCQFVFILEPLALIMAVFGDDLINRHVCPVLGHQRRGISADHVH
ncbi:hypothetical protein D3C80_1888830 [compost metagenome]